MTDLRWRKSSRSNSEPNQCVEVATTWRKSRRSAGNGGNCVEVARTAHVLVRDSKDPDGPKLAFNTRAWSTFLTVAKAGRYDLRR